MEHLNNTLYIPLPLYAYVLHILNTQSHCSMKGTKVQTLGAVACACVLDYAC